MTIGTTLSLITVEGNGVTTSFAYPFLVPASSQLNVTYTDANSNATVLTTSEYSVSGIGSSSGGTITYPLSGGTPIAAGTTLTIARQLPLIQGTSLTNQGPTFAAIEAAFDYLTMLVQQVEDQAARAIQINPADTALALPLPIALVRAGQYMAFDSNGNPIAALSSPGSVPVSSALQPFVNSASLAIARNYLGVAPTVTPQQFGAVGNGSHDDTAAIQAAINALPASGGDVLFPPGKYKVTSTLTIGNGSAGNVSTVQGIRLLGSGVPCPVVLYWNGFQTTPATEIIWAGGAAAVISINGPLHGWGVQSLHINGSGTATYGIEVISAKFGSVSDVIVENCVTVQIASTTVATWAGCDLTDSLKNAWRNIIVGVPATANAGGILLTGEPGNTSDTDTNHFDNLLVAFSADANTHWGVHLQNCDTNYFNNVHMSGGGSNTYGFVLDYTGSAGAWPGGCQISGVDCGMSPWLNVGGPAVGQWGPNLLTGLSQGNGGLWPNLAGLTRSLPVLLFGLELANQTGGIALQTIFTPGRAIPGALFRVSFYLTFGTNGTGGTLTPVFGWNDGGAQTLTAAAIPTTGGAAQGSFICAVSTGGISMQVTASGITGSPNYFLFVNVEQMS